MGYYELHYDRAEKLWLAYDAYGPDYDWSVICTASTRQECIDKVESKGWRWAGE